jgi:hypothetical protein
MGWRVFLPVACLALIGASSTELSPERAKIVQRDFYQEAYQCMLWWDQTLPAAGLNFKAVLRLSSGGQVIGVSLQPRGLLNKRTTECLVGESCASGRSLS